MNKINVGLTLATGAGLLFASPLMAQNNDSSDDDIVELSPFEVDASNDTGYRANSTLAGSRLNTQLKDVAASVTVITSEFMEDLGATNVEEALAFVASAETGQTFEADTNAAWVGGGQNTQPSRNRIRGLSRADTTADFFATSNPHIDSYNIDRIAVVRGPNSVLFGLGSPSGIINYSKKKASVARDFGEFELALDNFGTVRSEFDYNKILFEDKLAVRAMGLVNDKRYQYDTAFDRDKRGTIAFTYKPTEKTEFRLNMEEIDINARRPRYIPPEDHITRWVEGGEFTINPGESPAPGTGDFFDDMAHIAARNGFIFTDMNQVGPDFAIKLENVRPDLSRQSTANRVFMRRSSNPDDGRNFYTPSHVKNDQVFPFRDIDLGALPGSYQTQETTSKQLMMNHRFNKDFNIEVGFHKDETRRSDNAAINPRTSLIAVDVNETLTDGSVNPNFRRPFVIGRDQGSTSLNVRQSFRVQGSYVLDFEELADNNWLGKHRFSALYSDSEFEDFRSSVENLVGTLNHEAFMGEDALLNNSGRRIASIYYVADALAPGQTIPNFTGFPETKDLNPNYNPIDLRYYDDVTDSWVDSSRPIEKSSAYINGTRGLQKNTGLGVTMQSFFWNNKIVTTLGYRDDEVEGQAINAPVLSTGERNRDFSQWVFDADPEVNSDSTVTKAIVYHATDWLSMHYNESENFVVTGPAVDILNRPLPGSSGVGEDYGFSLNLLENKLNVKVNWYETSQKDSRNGGLAFVAVWRMRGFERGIYSRINNGSWEDTNPDLEWVRWDGSTENHDRLPNVSDRHDYVAEGIELEMTYNPTPNWRIMFNASKGETIQTKTGLSTLEYIDLRSPYWEPLWDLRWSSSRTVRDQFNAAVGGPLYPALAADGRVSLDQAKYSWNMVSNYKFTEGRFKGFAAGGSLRWSDNRAIGYRLSEDDEGNLITDLTNAYFGPKTLTVGLHASFTKKIFNDAVNWKMQLNIQNANSNDDLIPIRKNPDGANAAFRIGREPVFRLSNSFKF